VNCDFYAEWYGKNIPINWNPYTKIKLTKIKDTKKYEKQIKYYTDYEILPAINMLENLGLIQKDFPINELPKYSIFLKIVFNLKKSYIGADDEGLYPKDNPVCKDKVFKVPYVRPSSWKGALRWVAKNVLKKDSMVIERLFGNEKENEIARQGRLTLYPTFFNKIDLDVITPLKRDDRTPARGPITFEVAPGVSIDENGEEIDGAEGTFSLLYVPFDLIGKKETIIKKEVKEDLEIIRDSIKVLLSEYGFSAKKTSGYGVIIEENFFYKIIGNKISFEPTFEGGIKDFKELKPKLVIENA